MLFNQSQATLHKRLRILGHLGSAEVLAARTEAQPPRLAAVVRCRQSHLAIVATADTAYISRITIKSDPASAARELVLKGSGKRMLATIDNLPDRAQRLLHSHDEASEILAAAQELIAMLAAAVQPIRYHTRTGISESDLDRLFQGAYLLLRTQSDDLSASLAKSILLPSDDVKSAKLSSACALVFKHILAWHAPTASAMSASGNRFNCRRERLFVFPDFTPHLTGHEVIELMAEASARIRAFYAEAAADPAIAGERPAAYRELGLDPDTKDAA